MRQAILILSMLEVIAGAVGCSNQKSSFNSSSPQKVEPKKSSPMSEEPDQAIEKQVKAGPAAEVVVSKSLAAVPEPTMVVVPPNAIVKGSFTVFTVPADPAPNENYTVFVKVTLPKQELGYSRNDLTLHLLGSDGFEIYLTDGKAFEITALGPVADHPILLANAERHPLDASKAILKSELFYAFSSVNSDRTEAVLSIDIPGTESKIRDSVAVQSKILNEKQSVTLEF